MNSKVVELARIERVLDAGKVPLLRAEASRLRRWKSVLSAVPGAARQSRGSESELVLALHPASRYAARLYSVAKQHPVRSVSDWEDAARELRASAPSKVTVIAARRACSAHALARFYRLCADAGIAQHFGLITGIDSPGLAFSAAKALFAPSPSDGPRVTVIDAVHRNPPPADAIAESADAAVLVAHGEGAHAKLGEVTLCGLVGQAEVIHRRLVVDGCNRQPAACRRSRGRQPVFAQDCHWRSVLLLTCNGASIAAELYPTNVSLALAFLEGYAVGLVATITRVAFRPHQALTVVDALLDGWSLGEICQLLNWSARGALQPAFIALGDADFRVSPREDARLTSIEAPAGVVVRLSEGRSVVPEVDNVDGRLYAPHRSRGEAFAVADATSVVSAMRLRLSDLARALPLARHIIDGSDGSTVSRSSVDRLDSVLGMGRGLLARAAERQVWLDGDVLLEDELLRALAAVAASGAQKSLESPEDAYRRSVEQFEMCDIADAGWCSRCNRSAATKLFRDPLGVMASRATVECRVCGPLTATQTDGGCYCTVSTSAESRRLLRIQVSMDADEPEDAFAASISIADKAKGVMVFRAVETGRRRIAIDAHLDAPLVPDLHTVRVVAWAGPYIAFARSRILVR